MTASQANHSTGKLKRPKTVALVLEAPREIEPHPTAGLALLTISRRAGLSIASIADSIKVKIRLIRIRRKSAVVDVIHNAVVVVVRIARVTASVTVRIPLIRVE